MKRFLKWLIIILITVLILTVISAMAVAYAVFSPEKINKPASSTADEKALATANMKLGIALFAVYASNEKNASATQVFELTEAEFNALMTQQMGTGGTGDTFAAITKDERAKDLWLILKNSSFVFTYSKDAFWTPFGSYINGEGVANMTIKDGSVMISVGKTHLGRIGIPESFVQKTVDSQLAQFRRSETHASILRIIESLEVKDGKIVIVYRPYELRKMVGAKLLQSGISIRRRGE